MGIYGQSRFDLNILGHREIPAAVPFSIYTRYEPTIGLFHPTQQMIHVKWLVNECDIQDIEEGIERNR